MASRRKKDAALIGQLGELFREYGFEGTTIARVSAATGLQKSSLYHHFPDGKAGMAREVMDLVGRMLADEILAPLDDEGVELRVRLQRVCRKLEEFYDGGAKACLLDTLSLGDGDRRLQRQLTAAYESWVDRFRRAAQEAGLPPELSEQRAVEALVRLEGALVVARVGGDKTVFRQTLARLPDLLTVP